MSLQPSLKILILRHRLALALSASLAALGSALGLLPYYLVYLVSDSPLTGNPGCF